MPKNDPHSIVDAGDAGRSRRAHPDEPADFEAIAERLISRRRFCSTAAFVTAAGFAGPSIVGSGIVGMAIPGRGQAANHDQFTFEPVPANTLDTITVPKGFRWYVVVRWGDPLWSSGTAFDHTTRGTGASQALACGDNNDGMALFTHAGRSILAVNNESVNLHIIHGNRASGLPENADDAAKSKAGHGVSIFEIHNPRGRWEVVVDSPYNRRITADTPMDLTGPARGHDLMKTAADPAGVRSLGTWNNCGSGRTPWGTYLTCEENFNHYFSSHDPDYRPSPALDRYGVKARDRGYGWAEFDERFDISKHPNEPNRVGYVVEIDPREPSSIPKKRTALGRFKHENAEVVVAADGRVIVYMGDDERGEFLYRFISRGRYVTGESNADLLDSGQLFAARFSDDGHGEWIALTPETTGIASVAEICIHTRQAASAIGATTMDRPEWIAAHPMKAELFCSLTNNSNRGIKPNRGGDPTPVGGPNPRAANHYGQIVRWRPDDGDHTATSFTWDLYVLAGNPTVHDDARAGSSNVTAENMFNGPDGLAFDHHGGLWIQIDGKYSNAGDFAGQGNNQMLRGDPETGTIRRFLVGPRECEITGISWSGDRRTLFVGIQHPGERGGSRFPDGAGTVPRSSIIAITRDDAGTIG